MNQPASRRAYLRRPRQCLPGIGPVMEAAFSDWFALKPLYARLLLALFSHPGQPIAIEQLRLVADSHRPMSRHAVHEAICSIRKAMNLGAIDTAPEGYTLTPRGLAECRQALREECAHLARYAQEPHTLPAAERLLHMIRTA